MAATVTMETRQNEPEQRLRLQQHLRQELGPAICELLDKSTNSTSRITDIRVNAAGAVWFRMGGECSQVGAVGCSPAMSTIAMCCVCCFGSGGFHED